MRMRARAADVVCIVRVCVFVFGAESHASRTFCKAAKVPGLFIQQLQCFYVTKTRLIASYPRAGSASSAESELDPPGTARPAPAAGAPGHPAPPTPRLPHLIATILTRGPQKRRGAVS
jgi:hypothetical protein